MHKLMADVLTSMDNKAGSKGAQRNDGHKANPKNMDAESGHLLSGVCLLAGIAGGWSIRGSKPRRLHRIRQTANLPTPALPTRPRRLLPPD